MITVLKLAIIRKVATVLSVLFIFFNCYAQNNSAVATKLLFRNIKTTLTAAEKSQLFNKTGFTLSKDNKQFAFADDPESLKYPFDVTVLPADLNNDGKEELFLIFGNSYTSGNTGSNVILFIKDKQGKYQSNFGFSGSTPIIMPTKNQGFPELLIGGPGFEFPVWRWNGKEYVFNRKITEKSLSKIPTVNVEDASKIYTAAIKQ